MHGPDSDGISVEVYDGGRFTLTALCYEDGNRRHRIARLPALMRRMRFGGWKCRACGEPAPHYKRADADFCSERCRKAEARARRRNPWGE